MSVQHYMNRDEILEAIEGLAQSQGCYTRLYQSLNNVAETNPEQYNLIMEHLQQQHFKDTVDLVLFFES